MCPTFNVRFSKCFWTSLTLASALLCACSTPPVLTPRLLQEQIRNLPKERSQVFEKKLLTGVEIQNDSQVSQLLTKLVQSLKRKEAQSDESAPDEVTPVYRFYRTKNGAIRDPKSLLSAFILPPHQGFIEHRFALSLGFENELAAAVAFSWELALDTEFQENFLKQIDEKNPDSAAVYTWNDVAAAGAVERATDRMYLAGYDPRGLITMLAKMKEWSPERVQYLQEKARRTIAFYTPLMNPIVRSESFYRLRKQLEKW